MPIAIRSFGTPIIGSLSSTDGNYTFDVPVPPDVQVGDYLIIAYRCQQSDASARDPSSSGWTLLTTPRATVNNGSATRVTAFLGYPVTGPMPSTIPLNVIENRSARHIMQMIALTGVDVSNPKFGTTQQMMSGQTSVPAWADPANKYVLEMYGAEFTANNSHVLGTYDGPLTKQIDLVNPTSGSLTVSRTVMRVHAGYVGANGNPNHRNEVNSTPSSPSVWQIALNDAPPSTPQGLLVDWKKAGDSRTTARITAISGGAEKVVTTMGYIPSGYESVKEMLKYDEFMSAHRGGSADWPEMTRRAYTNAAAWGAGMLEFSSFRTSDGVWLGSHDATTGREFPSHPNVDIRNVTWAELQPYRTVEGLPFYKLEDFLREFAKTHICLVDNKAGNFAVEYLNILDYYGGPSRIVNKSWSGSSSNREVARLAGLRGYESWGFIYDSEIGNLPTWKQHWTWMGLEYSAQQSSWDTLVATGLVMLAHIMPTAAAVQTAKTKILQAMVNTGVKVRYGYQISGVKSAIPRKLPASVTLL